MTSRILAISSWLCLSAVFCACGDDDDNPSPDTDAGVDGGPAGSGGSGGKGGSGGGGKGGQGGGASGEGGGGGTGGSGGNGDAQYTVGGEVSGLNGSGLVIKLNDSEETAVDENGEFTFDTKLGEGDNYEVTVKTQPSNPVQACEVTSGKGEIDDSDIDHVEISCSDVKRSIGGNVTGLGDGEIKLKNNEGEILTIGDDGSFTFPATIAQGGNYDVSIDTLPMGRTCSLTKNMGTTGNSNVTDVTIACYEGLTLSARARAGSVGLSWNNNGAQSYTVHRSTDRNCDFNNASACANHAEQANVTSPYNWSLDNGTVYYFHVRGNHPDDFQTFSATTGAPGARPNSAEINGPVNAIARGGDVVYIGGAFTSVGPFTGPAAPIDRTTGLTSRMPNFPVITGENSPVSAIIADGSGGYFVGGTFTIEVSDTVSISRLAHVRADGTVDPAWNPAPNGAVTDLALVGERLYLAGAFSEVGSEADNGRAGLAAVSTTGAGALADWNPNPAPTGTVTSIVANAQGVFVAGLFTSIGGVARTNLARLDAVDGDLVDFPLPNAPLTAFALSDDTLYIAGGFDQIGATQHYRLAAIALAEGNAIDPDVELGFEQVNPPDALAVSGNLLILGGNFENLVIGGMTEPRVRLAAIDRNTGVLQDWAPAANGRVQALAAAGDTIYVAGSFENIGTTPRRYLAAIGTNGNLQDWSPQPQGEVNGISVDNNQVFAFGNMIRSFGVEPHQGLAAFNNGALTAWGPAATGGVVHALAVDGTTVFVGGDFDNIGGMARNGAAAVSDANVVLEWDAELAAESAVTALAVGNGRVYLGGEFDRGDNDNLVALTTSDAAKPDAWTLTSVDAVVRAILLDDSDLYIGGAFENVGATGRTGLAKLNADTGALVSEWTADVTGTVLALATVGDNLYVGGEFSEVSGEPAVNVAGVARANPGEATNFAPDMALDGPVNALAGIGDILYMGGEFMNYGIRLAIVDTSDDPPTRAMGALQASVLGGINALAVSDNRIYVAGDIQSLADADGSSPCWNFCERARPIPED